MFKGLQVIIFEVYSNPHSMWCKNCPRNHSL